SNTRFQSGEEVDYFLRALEEGHRIWFDPEVFVHHPSPQKIQQRIIGQTYSYALGTGFVLGKHGCSVYRLTREFVGYAFCGALLSLCKADIITTRTRAQRIKGLVEGYVSGHQSLARTVASESGSVTKPSTLEP